MKHSLLLVIMRVVGILLGLMLIAYEGWCQQDPLYGLYLTNPLVINPAYTGITNNLNVFTGYRNQWAGFDGSPVTMNAGAHISLLRNKVGVGAMIVNDKIGENSNTQLTASFAYKLPVSEGTNLSFGMQAGLMNYKSDPSMLILQDRTDPLFTAVSEMKPTLGVGVMLKGDRFLLGLSVPRLVNSAFDIGGQKIEVYQQHYYLFGAYLFRLSESIIFKPSILAKAVSGAPLSTDVNFNVIYHNNYTIGAYTRNLESYGMLAQFSFLENFRISYAAEMPTNQSVGSSFVTHELLLGIRTGVLSFHDKAPSNF